MALNNQQILDFLLKYPNLQDVQIAAWMRQNKVTPKQVSQAVGLPLADIEARYNRALPFINPNIEARTFDQGESTRTEYYIKGTDIQVDAPTFTEVSPTTGLTESSAPEFKANNITIYDPQAKGEYVYTPEGELIGFNAGERTSGFGGLLQDVYRDSKGVIIPALTFGALSAAGLLGGTAGTAATVGTTGLTAAELAQLDLALGGVGGTTGATTLASALTTGATVPTLTNLTGGSGVGTLGVTGANGAFLGEGALSGVPASDLALANAPTAFELANAGASAFTPTTLTPVDTTGLLTTPVAPPVVAPPVVAPPVVAPPVVAPPVVAPPVVAPPVVAPPVVAPPVVAPPVVVPPLVSAVAAPIISSLITPANVANLVNTGATTAAGLLQQQTSREAALAAQQRIDAETAAAKTAAQFRPIGMTTRFGTSQFQVDPVTGQLTSAGYTLSPEAKAQQDRFVALSNQGLTQVEQAQAQFAPLQAGAQQMFNLGQGYLGGQTDPRLAEIASQYLAQSPESKMLTSLGSQYIAQSPEQVAQNYLNQQMALLQPGRELELANLQNRLQQQGRGGLSVAQGGSYGATTPELQALYNARAMQEAQLAAQAQQAGQQQVQFGAGLFGTGQKLGMEGQAFGIDTLAKQQALEQQRLALGTSLYGQGAQNLGQYYAGQQAAFAPYTTAMGQAQALEAAGQQPFTLSAGLGQTSATAGARVGALGLEGANISQRLATGAAATTNPYSTALSGVAANPVFGQMVSGLFGNQAATALDFSAYGTGDEGFNRMIQDIYG